MIIKSFDKYVIQTMVQLQYYIYFTFLTQRYKYCNATIKSFLIDCVNFGPLNLSPNYYYIFKYILFDNKNILYCH